MAVLLLSSLILLLLCSSTLGYSLTLLNAAQMLSNSGYLSMSLTLQLISKTLNLDSPTATIFAPSDSAFVRSGQPSLNLFQYHVLPRRLSIETLKTLPKGTRIPTIVPKRSLIVTASPASSDGFISINGVKIDEKASFDDDSVIVYGIGEFFKPISKPAAQESSSGAKIGRKGGSIGEGSQVCGVQSFESVADFLRTRDYSIMAAFLDAQLTGFNSQMGLTIFAPVDEAIAEEHPKNISDFSLIFRQHVVPRLLPWKDLIGIDGGTKLQTFSRGFVVNVSVSDGVVLLNESPIVFQDLYQSDWLVVHGLSRLLTSPAEQDSMEDSFSDGYVGPDSHDYGDYH
ncbi:putative fasciclin-like arabinogalactan protein 20 [Ziziphus jujuba]|uniref:Fasciclin-like arabinogalactan protein 20 n=1 Tax=Ziziphus jujuba TaxID=326968 RepID=A0A6P4B5N2_ZIZJJ|nr:putative fasciclin-like arabinogalactan protein 20 [Ziziphus jujuba]